MSDDGELDLNSLNDEELVQQVHDDLYDGLKEEVEAGMLVVGLGDAEQLVMVALLEHAIWMQKLLAMPRGLAIWAQACSPLLCLSQ